MIEAIIKIVGSIACCADDEGGSRDWRSIDLKYGMPKGDVLTQAGSPDLRNHHIFGTTILHSVVVGGRIDGGRAEFACRADMVPIRLIRWGVALAASPAFFCSQWFIGRGSRI
jgi:hypothetical protein